MTAETIILTVISSDRPGIIQQLSDVIRAQGGNWLESSLSRLAGQFAGVISVSIELSALAALKVELSSLVAQGIQVEVHHQLIEESVTSSSFVDIEVEANDRPGIVEEISTALANKQINVEKISTRCESASMAGYNLFIAKLKVALIEGMSTDDVESILENVSDDVMVTVVN